MKTVVGVMGPGSGATDKDRQMAFELGRQIASRGWVLLSGGRSVGVMDAVNQGAKQAGGLTIGVLPIDNTKDKVSEAVDVAIVTGMGSARNNINVLSSDVVIACGTLSSGTLSEVALAIKANKRVILLSEDEQGKRFVQRVGGGLVRNATTVDEAIVIAENLLAEDVGHHQGGSTGIV